MDISSFMLDFSINSAGLFRIYNLLSIFEEFVKNLLKK